MTLMRVVWAALFSATLWFGLAGPGAAKTTAMPASGLAARLSEPAGGFSYVPPPGWHIRTFPGAKYRISFAKPAAGFAPNINVVDETAAVSLDRYMQMSQPAMQKAYTGFHVLSQSPFVTNAGLHGVRMAVDGTFAGRHVRQTFYVFAAANNRKIIVTASWLAADGNKYAAAADGAMKTFLLK